MPPRRSSRPGLLVVFAVFAVALPLGGYYLAVERPERALYFNQSEFRALGVLAEQIESTIENRLDAVKAAATSPDRDPAGKVGLIRDLTYVPNPGAQCGVSSAETPIRETVYVEPHIGLPSRSTSLLTIGSTGPQNETAAQKADSTVYFRYDCKSAGGAAEDACPKIDSVVCAKGDLSEMLRGFIGDSNLNDADLFIADEDGRVLFERGRADFRITKLPRSSGREHAQVPGTPTPTATPKQGNQIEGLPFIEDLTAASTLHDLERTSEKYKLFTHPIRLPAAISVVDGTDRTPAEGAVWVLGVLVPEKQFASEVSKVSLGSLVYLPLVLLLVVLVAPAIKLAIMGPRDRLSRNDMRALVVCAVLATGIITVIELDTYAYSWLERALDAESESISRDLRDDFRKEVKEAYGVLHQFVDMHARAKALEVGLIAKERYGDSASSCPLERRRTFRNGTSGFVGCRVTNMFTDSKLADCLSCPKLSMCALCSELGDCQTSSLRSTVCGKLCGCSSWLQSLSNRKFFDLVFWADECGQQWEKWTAADETTPLIDMHGLTPFENTIQQRLWEIGSAGCAERLSVDLLVSPNTGERLADISIPIVDSDDGCTPIGVAGLIAHLVSFYQPVLPPGFGFAVIQDDGKVVFHSQRQRSLYENFFEELSSPYPLRSLIGARRAGFLQAEYHGRTHRLYAHPIEDAPWSLIVFYDKELLRTADLDILSTCSLLFLTYVTLASLLWLLIHWFLPADDADWLWPSANRHNAYAACTVVLVLFGATFAWEVHHDNSLGLLMISLTGPAASIAYVYLRLARNQECTTINGRCYRRWLAGASLILSAFCVFCVVIFLALQSPTGWRGWALPVWCALTAGAATCLYKWPDFFGQIRARIDSWLPRWFWYVGLGLSLLFVVAVLPAIAFYQDAFEQGVEVFIRYGQLTLAERLVARNHQLTQQFHGIWEDTDLRERLKSDWDLPPAGYFWDGKPLHTDAAMGKATPCANVPWATPVPTSTGTPAARSGEFTTGLWNYLTGGACMAPTPTPTLTCGSTPTPSIPPQSTAAVVTTATPSVTATPIDPDVEIVKGLCRITGHHFSSIVMAYLPVYHSESMQLRNMIDDRAGDDRWTWTKDCDGRGVLSYSGPSGQGSPGTWVLRTWERVPLLPIMPTVPLEWLAAIFLLVLSLIAGYLILQWFADRVFGLKQIFDRDDEGLGGRGSQAYGAEVRGALLINPSREIADQVRSGVGSIDMQMVDDSLERLGETALSGPNPWVVVSNLDHRLDDTAWNRSKLALLERLILGGTKPVFVISKVDPLVYFRERLRSPGDTKADESYIAPEEIDRWARVLERLVKIDPERWRADTNLVKAYLNTLKQSAYRPSFSGQLGQAAVTKLWDECQWTVPLQQIASATFCLRSTLDDDRLVEYVRDMARAYYRSIWSLLTDEECLALIHLAKEGFINPNNWRLVERLESKGLIRRTPANPALRLMNQSFKEFVVREESPEQVRDWEGAAGASVWNTTRNVILAVLVVVGIFVAFFQPAALNLAVGSLTALVGALGALTSLFGFFQRGRIGSPRPPGS